ncbi:unnamed protein product, partial [Clonostachys chloroleuca]
MTCKWIQDQKMTDYEGLRRASVKLRGSWIEENVNKTTHPVATLKEDNCSRDALLQHPSQEIT